MTDKQFLELLKQYAPAIRDAVLAGIRDLRDNALLVEIERLVAAGDIEGTLRALGYNPAVFNGVYVSMAQAFEAGGVMMMAGLPKYTDDGTGTKTLLRFNVRDPAAEEWLRHQSSTLITAIEDDMRVTVQNTLETGLREGNNPRKTALDIVGRYDSSTGHREGGVLGLAQNQEAWSRSARAKLTALDPAYFEMGLRDARFDGTVKAAIESGKPLPVETVDKLIDRYRARALQYRGETIGRTETLAALNRSEFEATRQALAQSGLPPRAAQKEWDSAGDNRVRFSHHELDGQRVGVEEAFLSPVTGASMMHPGDTSMGAPAREIIDCRCRVRYHIDFAYGVE